MQLDNPVFAPNATLPTHGEEGQTCFITGVGMYTYISGVWVQAGTGSGGGGPASTDQLPEGQSKLYFTEPRVLATTLTGFAAGANSTVLATDTVEVGLEKIQGQLNAVVSDLEDKLDATANAVSATKLVTARNINGVAFDGTANITIDTSDSTKEPIITAGTTGDFYRGDKTFQPLNKAAVGLSDVDNTSDAAKPISTATQSALDGKLGSTATAAAATKLATARNINGVPFDGTTNITVPAVDSSKEPIITAGSTDQYYRGDKTFVDFATSVRSTALTGLSTSAVAVTASDTALVAVGKLQGQITNLVKSGAVAASAIDLAAGAYFTKTITAATTFTATNVPASGTAGSFLLELTNGGSQSITWFSGVTWPAGITPTLTTAGVDILGFYTLNGGTTWRGILMSKDIK